VAKLAASADKLWNGGDRKEARARYREAGEGAGPTAEAAWLALARRELSVGDADAARKALASYAARFPSGELAAEAAGIEFRTALLKGDQVRADQIARKLVQRYPTTPQGEAAARWRRERGARR
jgi:TolA-binding protein